MSEYQTIVLHLHIVCDGHISPEWSLNQNLRFNATDSTPVVGLCIPWPCVLWGLVNHTPNQGWWARTQKFLASLCIYTSWAYFNANFKHSHEFFKSQTGMERLMFSGNLSCHYWSICSTLLIIWVVNIPEFVTHHYSLWQSQFFCLANFIRRNVRIDPSSLRFIAPRRICELTEPRWYDWLCFLM